MAIHYSGLHHSLARLWPELCLHDQPYDDGPHQELLEEVGSELKEVNQEAEKVYQKISKGGLTEDQEGNAEEEDYTNKAGALSTIQKCCPHSWQGMGGSVSRLQQEGE